MTQNPSNPQRISIENNIQLVPTVSTNRTLVEDVCFNSEKGKVDSVDVEKARNYGTDISIRASTIYNNELLSQIEDKEAEERKITRALDIRMMPLFCVFYFMDYLDRANIGNATLGGIEDDLFLTPKQLGTAISAFYITYILFEVPSNVILKKISPVKWLSFIMFVWGMMTLIMAFSSGFKSLLICRLLIGAAESGYVPGILYMMSKVYKPGDFGLRVAVLLCMSSLSGIFSGPIAYGAAHLGGEKGLRGWQYLFILEGVPTMLLSIVSYFYLFDDISDVSWLTETQKAFHREYMKAPKREEAVKVKDIMDATFNIKTLLFSSVLFFNVINHTSHSVFSPIIIDGFGFSVLTSQLLSAPPSVIQTMTIIFGGYLADKFSNRSLLLFLGFCTVALGYTLLLILTDRWACYASLFVIPLGLGFQGASNLSWSAINFPKLEIRVIAVAVTIMIGNSGGIVASYLYPSSDAPHFYFGNTFNLVSALIGASLSGLTGFYLRRQNRKLDMIVEKSGKSEEELTEEERFRYYY